MNGYITVLLVMILPILVTTEHDVSPINRDIGFQFDNFPRFKLSLQDEQFDLRQRTTLVPDQMGCAFECVRETWCLSVNFNTTEEKGLHACELMSAVVQDHPKNLTQDNNFIHFSIKNPCAEKPCKNGGECNIRNNRQDYKCQCNKGFSVENCQNPLPVNISILSGGYDDVPDVRGKCIIRVNDVDHCPNSIGHNVVVLDKYGVYQTRGVFDTYGRAAQDLKNFLNNLPNERIVLIAIRDSGEQVGEAAAALQAVGAVNPTAVAFRSSWLLVGYKGGSPSWITEKRTDRYKGPSQANVTIPVPVTHG